MSPTITSVDLDTLVKAPYGFLTGTAGTGKTTIARTWAESTRTILCATTGIAAVNLGDCTTVNSLLTYFDTKSLEEKFVSGYLSMKLRKLYRAGIRRLVLDEVSMLDAHQLTILTQALDEASGKGYVLGDDDSDVAEADDNHDPLGLTLVGDFAQLSPVKAPFAFLSPEWERYERATCVLTQIHRQQDEAFVHALQAVRAGQREQAAPYFLPRLSDTTDTAFAGTTILAKNDAVLRYNHLRLNQLTTPVANFPSRRWGKLRPEWGTDRQPPAKWGIPQQLQLRDDCLVMVLANKRIADSMSYEYVNGDLGWFRGVQDHWALVELQRTGETVLIDWVTRDHTIPLEPGRRKALRAEGHEDRISGKHEIVGQVTYMPLRVAYASTVHKSQGLTLDSVQINIRDGFFRTPGMLYVALSRCRTAGGLRIVGTRDAFVDRIRVDERVRGWL